MPVHIRLTSFRLSPPLSVYMYLPRYVYVSLLKPLHVARRKTLYLLLTFTLMLRVNT